MTAPQPEPHPAVAAMAAYACPDCTSETALQRDPTGVWALQVAHDPSCPWLAAHDRP